MKSFVIKEDKLDIDYLIECLESKCQYELDSHLLNKVSSCRNYLEKVISNNQDAIYGINTGFGALCNKIIAKEKLIELQHNLIRSHACGIGKEIPPEITKLILLLKIRTLSYGHSGVKTDTIERLLFFLNNEIFPLIFELGSLGASGDLSPLAHLALPLIGEGKVRLGNKIYDAKIIEKKFGLKPLILREKEGLALINGTQFMSAYGVYCIGKLQKLMNWAIKIGSLSYDAFDCMESSLSPKLHSIRPHKGQMYVASEMMKILSNSEILKKNKLQVQDPYSFRCIPQVLGASFDVLWYAKSIFEIEINSVTDNPNVFVDEELILSGGNFHGQPLAMAFDFLSIAAHEIGSISERRIYQLISGNRELPSFLCLNPGLDSGLMILQYTAASIVSQNKQLTVPASTDSIESSAGQEDHVSMGANAATKLLRIIENLESILAIELFTAAQAIHFRDPLKTSTELQNLIEKYRKEVSFVSADRVYHHDIEKTKKFMKHY